MKNNNRFIINYSSIKSKKNSTTSRILDTENMIIRFSKINHLNKSFDFSLSITHKSRFFRISAESINQLTDMFSLLAQFKENLWINKYDIFEFSRAIKILEDY